MSYKELHVNDMRGIDFLDLASDDIRNKKNLGHLARPDVRVAGEEDTGRDRDLRNVFRRADILTTCQSNSGGFAMFTTVVKYLAART